MFPAAVVVGAAGGTEPAAYTGSASGVTRSLAGERRQGPPNRKTAGANNNRHTNEITSQVRQQVAATTGGTTSRTRLAVWPALSSDRPGPASSPRRRTRQRCVAGQGRSDPQRCHR